ncbi:precorrin-3B C17-methyltransferase [Pleurocapsa sp. PCC 7327]|uniref:precorrin-3B C(17)-methyltransferase n=1 Tax=Pleurocapsa sp. PCC 7327 TaxID=118163 RepID=UPI00029FBD41|nr:precorrin-3B C(17)-methyltransferase [Pleurocapsa sp. PCC 7327]AFY77293.1 precorrin-3B C17-methyltransferase [Pleurocapsa sp. PCC 7327]
MSQLPFLRFQPIAAIATTPRAAQLLQILSQSTGATLWVPGSLASIENAQVYTSSLKDQIASIWHEYRAFVFCLATGAVVRAIAPLLENKSRDPAVIVIDQDGHFVISLCGGHQGGADELARLIAHQLGAIPVLTGASASLNLPGIDILGLPFGWRKGSGDWTKVSAAISRRETVQVIQEVGSTLWQAHLPQGHPFYFGFPDDRESISPKARVWISATKRQFSPDADIPKVQWHPRVLWVGIGCERGTSRQLIEVALAQVCQRYHLATEAIAGIATIDLKADEAGILEYCRDRNLPLKTFPAEILRQVSTPNPSTVVEREVGTSSVAEAAAILGGKGRKLTTNYPPIPNPLIVPKQIVKLEGEPGAVTVAIALSELEYTGRTGQLLLVGTGPGNLEQMTPAAKTAVTGADAIVGYSLYLELIQPLLRPGQIVESLPITQERQRAQRAIELAQWGLTVAVVSSGDCGIYGMAGLVMEELQALGWNGKVPKVEVFPGITAVVAAAARVGAPLMHDFCTISLSDLLTPWDVIEKRLEAAAVGDFVTALYNPRSQTRTQQIITAREIFLKHRNPNTPVALVRSVYRSNEQISLTTLDKMLEFPIDMLTTVIIGNRSTRRHADWMITPRGYSVS